jgi:hypothetical protein
LEENRFEFSVGVESDDDGSSKEDDHHDADSHLIRIESATVVPVLEIANNNGVFNWVLDGESNEGDIVNQTEHGQHHVKHQVTEVHLLGRARQNHCHHQLVYPVVKIKPHHHYCEDSLENCSAAEYFLEFGSFGGGGNDWLGHSTGSSREKTHLIKILI